MSKGKTIGYWITTVLLALMMLSGGIFDLVQPPDFLKEVEDFGYPLWFFQILGVWKVLGAVAIVVPKMPLLKEWAYAGFMFDTTGAIASHAIVGHGADKIGPAAMALILVYFSWRLRPPSRRV